LPVEGAGLVEAFYKGAQGNMPTILFLHGNGGGISDTEVATLLYAEAGYGILMPEYPGYWGNPGKPSQSSLDAAAEAGMQWLEDEGQSRSEVIVMGNSIGSGPAIRTARKGAKQLVIISGMADLPSVVRNKFKFLPTFLLKDRYENEKSIKEVDAPTLVIHGNADELIPLDHGARLSKASDGDFLVVIGGHDIAFRALTQEQILEWLEDREDAIKPDA
jgi:pimeloyl-ACP methyl ester carboxylesterase